jgi:hypothetical protein
MGAGVFHGRVRDGNGCCNPAIATRPPQPERAVVGDWDWCVVVYAVRVFAANGLMVLRAVTD